VIGQVSDRGGRLERKNRVSGLSGEGIQFSSAHRRFGALLEDDDQVRLLDGKKTAKNAY
jgi:hypothetical protein